MTNMTIIVATNNSAQRRSITELVDALPDFKVVSCTGDLMNTYNQVEARLPTAVLISESLASLPEFEVMRALFSAMDVRWLILTAPDTSHRKAPVNAVGSDLFSVPGNAAIETILGQLRSLTKSSVSRPVPIRRRSNPAQDPVQRTPRAAAKTPLVKTNASQTCVGVPAVKQQDSLILIGASTGGVDALIKVLSSFPTNCPPTLIVQHTGAGFGESLARLLDRQCQARVTLAFEKHRLQRGSILLGAGTRAHLTLDNASHPSAVCLHGKQMSGHMPSVDMLFKSAVRFAPRVTAAILTGMGRDGADGLLDLRNAGATTIAQDEASSVIYGMPRAAIETGAAKLILPLHEIGPALLKGPQNRRQLPGKVGS